LGALLQYTDDLFTTVYDVNYFPSSLLTNGQADGPLEDYWAIVARLAGRWRDRLRQRIIENLDRDRFDFFIRFTWSFSIKEL
jgi:hypothetical protein